MRQIYAYEADNDRLHIQPVTDELFKQGALYREYLAIHFALKEPADFVVWTKASFASHIFGNHDLPAYNNGTRIIMCPDKKEWEDLLSKAFAPYEMPQSLVDYYRNLPDYQMTQIFLHEITHDSDLFGSEYGEARDDLWFEEGMCEYLSYRYILTDEELLEIRTLLQTQVDFFNPIFGGFHVEKFSEETYKDGNLAYLYTFYVHAFLTVCDLVDQFGSVEQVFEVYQDWWQNSETTSLFDWFKKKGK
ncbi:hypothetical protein AB1I63_03260 [Streptococcus pneumoniae]